MATEWAPYKIRVNALCPGYQATQLLQNVIETAGNLVAQWEKDTPMGRLGNPKELRGPVVFMASEASAFMTGHELVRLKNSPHHHIPPSLEEITFPVE